MSAQPDVVVLGGGLSGLSAAWHLKKAGQQVLLLEKSAHPGGVVRSGIRDGFLLEYGPNSASLTPDLNAWLHQLGLSDQMVFPTASANNRFVARDGRLHQVTPSLSFLVRTSLLSSRGKLRLLKEPWVTTQSPGHESVASFFTRRLGEEAYRYLINPVIGGIYAGDPEELGVESVMPTVVEMEKQHGSLFKGLKAKKGSTGTRQIFTLTNGLGEMAIAAHQYLIEDVLTEASVEQINQSENGIEIRYRHQHATKRIIAQKAIWALPACRSEILGKGFEREAECLASIRFVPMGMLHLGFRADDLRLLPDGFGFLTPQDEDTLVLGAIWNSQIFPHTAPDGMGLITVFVGGGRTRLQSDSHLLALIPEVMSTLSKYLEIRSSPTVSSHVFWPQAIPQYGIDHPRLLERLSYAEQAGLYFCGNSFKGVSVGAVVDQGKLTAQRVLDTLDNHP